MQRKRGSWPCGTGLENSKGKGETCIKSQGRSMPEMSEERQKGQCGWSRWGWGRDSGRQVVKASWTIARTLASTQGK